MNMHQPRISLAVDGQQYQLGDFAVRVGNVTVRANGEPRGTIVQVSYHTLASHRCCLPLLLAHASFHTFFLPHLCTDIVRKLSWGAHAACRSITKAAAIPSAPLCCRCGRDVQKSAATSCPPSFGAERQVSMHMQEFATMLREATATASGRLEAVQVPLQEFSLPPRFCHQHLAVQYTTMVQRLLAG